MTDNIPLLKPAKRLDDASHRYIDVKPHVNICLEDNLNDEILDTSPSFFKVNKISIEDILINLAFTCSWFVFSILLSMYNKWMFSEKHFNFKFPLFASYIHILIEYCLSIVIMGLFPQYQSTNCNLGIKDHLIKVIPCGIATSLEIGLSNASLKLITLSFYTMCKSSSLGFVLFFAFIFGLEKVRLSLIIIIIIITVGIIMMASTQVEFVFEGFLMAIMASAIGGVKWSLVQLLCFGNSTHINPFLFIYILSPSIFFSLAFTSLLTEGLVGIIYSSFWDYGIVSVLMLIAPGVIAFFMIVSEYWLIERTSIVTLSIAGICKEVITMVASAIFFRDHISFVNIIGFVITLTGIIFYNFLKYQILKEEAALSQKLDGKNVSLASRGGSFAMRTYGDIEELPNSENMTTSK